MKKLLLFLFIASILVITNFCGKDEKKSTEVKASEKKEIREVATKPGIKPAGQPDRITVQHILIAFKGTIPDGKVTRTREEAKTLAYQLWDKIKVGSEFDALVKEFTDDSHPGIYSMCNFGVEPESGVQEYPRAGMVAAFGDIGFPLKIGAVGIADYDPQTSKYGWHIIKRIK